MGSFSELYPEVRANLGNRTDIDVRVKRWVNYAHQRVCTMYPHRLTDKAALLRNLQGGDTFPLPADCLFVLALRDNTNGRKLRKSHWRVFDKIQKGNGHPARYCTFGGNLELDTTVVTAIDARIRYKIIVPLLVNDEDDTLSTSDWDEGIIILATAIGLTGLQRYEEATLEKQAWLEWVSSKKTYEQVDDLDGEFGVQVVR